MQSSSRPLLGRAVVSIGTALVTVVVLGGAAEAAPRPDSGDARAKATAGAPGECGRKGVGLGGDRYGVGDGYADPNTVVRYSDGEVGAAHVSIPQVKPGFEVLGVVVAGAKGFNLYKPGTAANPAQGLGDLPWMDLHAPPAGGKPAAISSWFVCAKAGAPAAPAPAGATPAAPEPAPAGPTCDGFGFTLDVAPVPAQDICLGQKR